MTRESLRARFLGLAPRPRASSAARLPFGQRGDHSLMPGAAAPSPPLTPAAVLVPLVEHGEGFAVLLTQRTQHLADHAGQIAFPGGRIEPEDCDAIAAALREAQEEVGLPPDRVEVAGRLDTYLTGTGFEITPIVGFVRAPYPTKLDPFEVAEIFEVPLDYVLDTANHQRHTRDIRGRTRSFFVLPYEGRNIWGATAGMLVNLAEVLNA